MMKHIKVRIKALAGIAALFGILTLGACGPGERNETDYVNEIEAEENSPGQPYIEEPPDISEEIEVGQDSLVTDEETIDPELREEEITE